MDDEGVWSGFMNLGMHAVSVDVGAQRSWLETGISVLALFFFIPLGTALAPPPVSVKTISTGPLLPPVFFLPRPTHFA